MTDQAHQTDRRCPFCGLQPTRSGAFTICTGGYGDRHQAIRLYTTDWNRRPLEDGEPTGEARHNALLTQIDGIARETGRDAARRALA